MGTVLLGIAISIASLAVISVVIYFLVLVRPPKKTAPDESLKCDYAHRGLHDDSAPENSLQAFENACRAGYGIELDVQLSRDGVVMVFHDYSLLRMTGCDKKLSELDATELTALSLKNTAETIPTFEQVLSLVDGRVPLLVELKGVDPGVFSIGDTICEAGMKVEYAGIPTFAPEHFALVEQIDSLKRKQFDKGITQIAQEGAIQMFFLPDSGMERVYVGVVGMLQFDVLQFRMESEYGVKYHKQDTAHSLVRFVESSKTDLKNLNLMQQTKCGNPPGSLVPGTLQARTLEWVAVSFSNA